MTRHLRALIERFNRLACATPHPGRRDTSMPVWGVYGPAGFVEYRHGDLTVTLNPASQASRTNPAVGLHLSGFIARGDIRGVYNTLTLLYQQELGGPPA